MPQGYTITKTCQTYYHPSNVHCTAIKACKCEVSNMLSSRRCIEGPKCNGMELKSNLRAETPNNFATTKIRTETLKLKMYSPCYRKPSREQPEHLMTRPHERLCDLCKINAVLALGTKLRSDIYKVWVTLCL